MDRAGLVTDASDRSAALAVIFGRRSYSRLALPAPTDEHLRLMLAAAKAAPDHGELRPSDFVVMHGPGAARDYGEVLAEAYVRRVEATGGEPVPAKLEKERTKLGRAPLVLAAVARHRHSEKIPWIEQQYAVAASCQNLLLAAEALGYGAMWRTGDPAYDANVKAALGLSEHDAIVGFVYIGTVPDGARKQPHPRDA